MATETTKIPFVEGAAAATPAASRVVIYAKADGLMYSKDDAGAETLMSAGAAGGIATDPIWDAAGDLVQGSGANTGAKLGAGTAGQFLMSAGAAAANLWAFPPGHEFDYAEITSDASITATSEGTPNTVITGNSVTYDGTAVWVEFYTNSLRTDSGAAARSLTVFLVEDSTVKGNLAFIRTPAAAFMNAGGTFRRKLTPSAGAHTYVIKAYVSAGTGLVSAGAGGTGAGMPAYLRVVKA